MALNIIVAGPNAESYLSVEEANSYIASRSDSKNWNDSDYLERERLLRMATIDIDVFRFKGTKLFSAGEGGGLEATPSTFSTFDFITYGYQRLQFPRNWQEYYTGYAESGTDDTLVDSIFSNLPREDDFFKYGAIYIMGGTNMGEFRTITGYTASTGTFSVSGSAFTDPIDDTSQYLIISPIDRYVKYAVVEQALFLTNNLELKQLQEWKMAGIVARSIGDVSIRYKENYASSMDAIGGYVSANAFRYIQKFVNRNADTGRA